MLKLLTSCASGYAMGISGRPVLHVTLRNLLPGLHRVPEGAGFMPSNGTE